MPPRQLLVNALWAGVGLRLVIAVWNGFFGPSFGAQGDGVGLHQLAADFAAGNPPETFRLSLSYIYFLGAFYWLITPSAFLGGLLSIGAWLVSALTLAGCMRIIGLRMESRAAAMVVYAALPSSIIWTGITMREPYQLLFVNVAMYAALRITLEHAARYWLVLLVAVACGALTHAALLGWGLCLMTAVFALHMYDRLSGSPIKLAAAAIVGVALVLAGLKLFTQVYSYPIERGLAFAVNSYQSGGLTIGARTDYRSTVDIVSTLDLLMFIPGALLQYLFEPLPWRVGAIGDLVPLAENLVRLGLLAQAVALAIALPRASRGPLLFTLAAYLVLETAWAIGTFNWGTAARHHIPSLGLLLLAAFAHPLPRTDRHETYQPPVHAAA